MFTKKLSPFIALTVLVIASLACSFGYNPQTGFTFQSGGSAAAQVAIATDAPVTADDGDQRAVGPQGPEDRAQHMLELNKIFHSQGAAAWLEAAGMPFDWASTYFDARQPEEETLQLADGTKIVVSGMQVDVRGLPDFANQVTQGNFYFRMRPNRSLAA